VPALYVNIEDISKFRLEFASAFYAGAFFMLRPKIVLQIVTFKAKEGHEII